MRGLIVIEAKFITTSVPEVQDINSTWQENILIVVFLLVSLSLRETNHGGLIGTH